MVVSTNGTAAGRPTGAAGEGCALADAWSLRNATAEALLRAEDHMRRQIQRADLADLVRLVEAFSPARSPSAEWSRSFEPLAERLWAWCDDETMAGLEEEFQRRGLPWLAVANAFAPERGAQLRGRLRQPAWSRFPSFSIA